MSDHLVLTFGMHKGRLLSQVPEDYVRWLAHPDRERPSEKNGRNFRPLDPKIVAAARAMLPEIDDKKAREDFAKLTLGGHPTGLDHPIYLIECDGDCHSKSGSYAIDHQWFKSLDLALAYLATEYPVEDIENFGNEVQTGRSTPDPEDDRILIWEVLPTSHRRPVWGFFGWHWSADTYQCGQGTLSGDSEDLFTLAARDY